MYCSNACKLRVWRERNPEADKELRSREVPKARTVSAYFAGYCGCGVAIGGQRERARCEACEASHGRVQGRAAALRAAVARHRQDGRVIACDECGCSFCPVYGSSNATLCMVCKEARAKAQKSAARMLRKAKERAAKVETVNPYRVFERDGWLCRLCGVPTPKAKRGTYEPDAPELDHVVPLSKGGDHSYANTQCACRRCNGAKSDALGWAPAQTPRGAEVFGRA